MQQVSDKKGQIIETEIVSLSHEGRGIAKRNGKTNFIFNALPGETARVLLTRTHSRYNEGDAVEIQNASADRIEPACPHFSLCGGCQLQYFAPEKQIDFKQSVLIELLTQQGVTPKHTLPPLTALQYGYRRKARLGVKFVAGKNKVLVGFRERGSSFVADLNQCKVLHPSIGEKIQLLSDFIFTLDARDSIPQLEIAIDDHDAAIIVRNLKPLNYNDKHKFKKFFAEHNLKLYWQSGGPETIRSESSSPFMRYTVDDLNFNFLPQQFTQVNFEINKKMLARAIELLDLKPEDNLLDLFCGIGNFSLPLAKRVNSVVGVEGDDTAVSMARYNALQNNLNNCDFITANLFEPIDAFKFNSRNYNKILIDPPRTGAQEIIPYIKNWRPEKLLYVSCNPITLARDAKLLADSGYNMDYAGVMDMFPQTKHVEAIALFSREKNAERMVKSG